MRVLIHDYGGYPFILQLSKELADRGHAIEHAWYSELAKCAGTQGDSLPTHSISAGSRFDRYSFVGRLRHEMAYGRAVGQLIRAVRPDAVINANTPLFASLKIQAASSRTGTAYIHWLQDVHGKALKGHAADRFGRFGKLLGRGPEAAERRLLQTSDAVVAISDNFAELARSWGVPTSSVTVIENWAEPIPEAPKQNDWAQEHALADREVVLYAGTLGLKHDVAPLLAIANALVSNERACLVVVAHGPGQSQLQEQANASGIGPNNLLVLDQQPYEDLPYVLATADVLLAVMRPEASIYSVPSKVLTYLAAGRPIVAAVPAANPASVRIKDIDCGIVVDPLDSPALVSAVHQLIADPLRRAEMAQSAREYADQAFNIRKIADRFERVLDTLPRAAVTSSGR